MPLDLSSLKDFVEGEMTDQFLIQRDAQGYTDDTYNPATMTYSQSADDVEQVYTGPGFMVNVDVGVGQIAEEGGEQIETLTYDLFIPLETPVVNKWDKVIVQACLRDPQLLDTEWYVHSELTGSFAVCRQIRCMNRKPDFALGLLQ